jgi:hypothetical protein
MCARIPTNTTLPEQLEYLCDNPSRNTILPIKNRKQGPCQPDLIARETFQRIDVEKKSGENVFHANVQVVPSFAGLDDERNGESCTRGQDLLFIEGDGREWSDIATLIHTTMSLDPKS